jgi:hypothetical protein
MLRTCRSFVVALASTSCFALGCGSTNAPVEEAGSAAVAATCEEPVAAAALHPMVGVMGKREMALLVQRYRAAKPDPVTFVPTDRSSPVGRAAAYLFEQGWPSKPRVPARALRADYSSAVAAKAVAEAKPAGEAVAMPWGAPVPWHDELVESDSREAYRSALAFALTGKTEYAAVVKRIMSAWMLHIPSFARIANDNAPLEVGWALGNMLKALLVLENAGPASAVTADEKEAYLAWIDRAAAPRLYEQTLLPYDKTSKVQRPNFYVNLAEQVAHRADYGLAPGSIVFGNWQTTMIETRMLLGLYRGEAKGRVEYDTAVDYALTLLDAYTLVDGEKALTAETCRDVYHAGFGIAGLVEMAELAWQQGDERLYAYDGTRLAKVVEYHSKIHRGVLTNADVGCDPRYGGLVAPRNAQPFHEIAFNHYAGRRGLALPQTKLLLANGTQDGAADGVVDGTFVDGYSLQWGYGTLMFRDSACTP